MFSQLGLRTSVMLPLLRQSVGSRLVVVVGVRHAGTEQSAVAPKQPDAVAPKQPDTAAKSAEDETVKMQKIIENWDMLHAKYYGPERDTKNFPHPKQPLRPPPYRLGFIPEYYFTSFYDKTGVTGPYLLGLGVWGFLMSKELLLFDEPYIEVFSFLVAIEIVRRKWGKKIGDWYENRSQDRVEERFTKPIREWRERYVTNIQEMEKAMWYEEGQKHLYQAKRDNVEAQVETAYRQQLANIHTAVKKRLDYQVDVQAARKRLEQGHMVNWITRRVVDSITPQQEKEAINKCFVDLRTLAAKVAV